MAFSWRHGYDSDHSWWAEACPIFAILVDAADIFQVEFRADLTDFFFKETAKESREVPDKGWQDDGRMRRHR